MHGLERLWYRRSPLPFLLAPLSVVFGAIVALRRALFRAGLLRSQRLSVPVIIVGNITAGGSGKTPCVLWLVELLRAQGYRPGIVSRGYGGTASRAATGPRAVAPSDPPAVAGDEPVLLAQRAGVPVWIGAVRAEAARELLAAHPDCNVIVSDDGLQHYALRRDVEIAVIDAARGLGNGWLLPAGPLREPVERLSEVDLVILNGADPAPPGVPAAARMHLDGDMLHNLHDPARQQPVAGLTGLRVHAVAGIGNPERFFDHVQALGLAAVRHPFPDHHAFQPADLDIPGADAIVMTEKDAVKCRAFEPEITARCWVLAVVAQMAPEAGTTILERLRAR